MTGYLADDPVKLDPSSLAIMDSKALFDSVRNEQCNGDDRQTQLEVAVIKDSFSDLGTSARWTPHGNNPTDGLTKLKGAHMLPLLDMMRTHHWQLRPESIELGEMQDIRHTTGRTPRPKIGFRSLEDILEDDTMQDYGEW